MEILGLSIREVVGFVIGGGILIFFISMLLKEKHNKIREAKDVVTPLAPRVHSVNKEDGGL